MSSKICWGRLLSIWSNSVRFQLLMCYTRYTARSAMKYDSPDRYREIVSETLFHMQFEFTCCFSQHHPRITCYMDTLNGVGSIWRFVCASNRTNCIKTSWSLRTLFGIRNSRKNYNCSCMTWCWSRQRNSTRFGIYPLGWANCRCKYLLIMASIKWFSTFFLSLASYHRIAAKKSIHLCMHEGDMASDTITGRKTAWCWGAIEFVLVLLWHSHQLSPREKEYVGCLHKLTFDAITYSTVFFRSIRYYETDVHI